MFILKQGFKEYNHARIIYISFDLFQDYMILIPQAYYEATILQNTVYRPCLTPDDKGPYVIS